MAQFAVISGTAKLNLADALCFRRPIDGKSQAAFLRNSFFGRWKFKVRSEIINLSARNVCSAGFDITKLEAYTEKIKNEVLLVHAEVDGEEDEVLVFRGFSSSLMRPTATDPSEPVLPEDSKILKIDRLRAPYNPESPVFIQEAMTLLELTELFKTRGI